jgi:hypothetical protein
MRLHRIISVIILFVIFQVSLVHAATSEVGENSDEGRAMFRLVVPIAEQNIKVPYVLEFFVYPVIENMVSGSVQSAVVYDQNEKRRGYDLVEILNGYQWENNKGEIKRFLWNSYLLKLSAENRKIIARRENSIDYWLRKTQPLVDAKKMRRRRTIRSSWKTE